MKKSELKKIVLEALTPDEAAKVEPKYKETYAAMIRGKGPLKLKKYDNPDKVVRGRVVNTIKNESLKIAEKLGKKADVGDYKDDFRKSDAPQFKGKSKKKRDQMDTAAFLNKEDQNLDEEIENSTFERHADRVEDLLRQLIGATNRVDSSQDDTEDDVEELDQSIDYLAAAITDKDPIDIAIDQSTFGRLAKPTKEEKTLKEIDAMMEESAYEAGRKAKDAKDKSEKNYSNYFKKMDKNKLEELVKAALMGPMNETSTDKYDDNPALKGKQSELPDGLQKSIIKKSGGKVDEGILQNLKNFSYGVLATLGIQKYGADVFNKVTAAILNALPPEQSQDFSMAIQAALESIDSVVPFMEEDTNESFDSLVKKVDKSKGYTKKEAEKVAGSIAAKKRAGAGKGPTAKQKKRMAETILKELRGNVNEMAGEDLELKSLAKKMIPTLKKLGFEVEYSTDTSMKTLKNAGDKFVALRVQDGMLGAHIPFKAGLDVAKEIQKEIQKSLGNKFEYKLTKSKRGPGLEFYTILIRNK